jgi:hypothetical protein
MHGTLKTHGTMQIMDITGHSSITWDPDRPVEVDVARASFDKLVKEGYSAFRVDEDDEKGERITRFDPQAGKIMMVPQLRGG